MSRGAFVAVVGPSGAGKDTLMEAAARSRPDLELARRVITRPPAPGTERFESVSEAEFERRRSAGAFALDWQAHGLSYAIPAAVERDVGAGRVVLANLSRAVLDAARARFPGMRVLVVTAAPEVLAARLAARGREDAGDIRRRLSRAVEVPAGPDVHVVDNGGRMEEALAAFLCALPQPVSG